MKRGLVRHSRYSPGNMDAESLTRLFVGREKMMDDVLERIIGSIGVDKERHYLLIVGPRGSGKTHFIALAYHRICAIAAEKGLRNDLEIAFLNEEEWGVASYLDFLVRVLRALASDSNDLQKQVANIYSKFATHPAEAESYAEIALTDFIGQKTLLLICENLLDLFEGLGDEGQKRWRALIQQTGTWTVLATTPALFAAVTLQTHPFYGFFTIRELRKLDYEGAHELLLKKAIHDHRDELARFIETPIGRARVRAIHHLAAGNHRAYVLLYDFLDKQSLDDLIQPFLDMVDDLTPYYQERMRRLSPAQRKILEYLCQNAEPTQVKEIAASCLMSHQTAAKQLGELMLSGFVKKSPFGRQTYCEIAEPLMRICIEVKDNRTEHFRLFVEFLRHWFSSREMERRVTFLEDSALSGVDRIHLEEALRCSKLHAKQPFLDSLRLEGGQCSRKGDYAGLAVVCQALVHEDGAPSDYYSHVYALRRNGRLNDALSVGLQALDKYPEDAGIRFGLAEVYGHLGQHAEALSQIDRALERDANNTRYRCFRGSALLMLERYPEAIAEAEALLRLDPAHLHSYEQIMQGLLLSGDLNRARQQADYLEKEHSDKAELLVSAARFYYWEKQFRRSLELLDKAVTLDHESSDARYARGLTHFELRNNAEARDDFQVVLTSEPKHIGALCRLGDTLMRLKDYRAAIDIARRLIEVDPNHRHTYFVLAHALIGLGSVQEGVDALRPLLACGKPSDLKMAADVAMDFAKREIALEMINRAKILAPEDPGVWEMQGLLEVRARTLDAARSTLAKALGLGLKSTALELALFKAESRSEPITLALNRLLTRREASIMVRRPRKFIGALADAFLTSVRQSGPIYLPDAMNMLRGYLSVYQDRGYLGEILTSFLARGVKHLKGSLEEWDTALNGLMDILSESKDCLIPLAVLSAAARYVATADERHLLQLPLEQRQLISAALTRSDLSLAMTKQSESIIS